MYRRMNFLRKKEKVGMSVEGWSGWRGRNVDYRGGQDGVAIQIT